MLSKNELIELANQKYSRNNVYGKLSSTFPIHYKYFKNMNNRVRDFNLITDFPRSANGFIDFLLYIGDVPIDMIKPTIGRINHDYGYIVNNFSWQSDIDNKAEQSTRNASGFTQIITCPWCNIVGQTALIGRDHFDNCAMHPSNYNNEFNIVMKINIFALDGKSDYYIAKELNLNRDFVKARMYNNKRRSKKYQPIINEVIKEIMNV